MGGAKCSGKRVESVMSWGRLCKAREMRSVAVPKMLRRVLCLTQTKWMALCSRSE